MAKKTTLRIVSTGKKKSNGGLTNQRSTGKHDFELGMRIRLRRVEMKISQSACSSVNTRAGIATNTLGPLMAILRAAWCRQ